MLDRQTAGLNFEEQTPPQQVPHCSAHSPQCPPTRTSFPLSSKRGLSFPEKSLCTPVFLTCPCMYWSTVSDRKHPRVSMSWCRDPLGRRGPQAQLCRCLWFSWERTWLPYPHHKQPSGQPGPVALCVSVSGVRTGPGLPPWVRSRARALLTTREQLLLAKPHRPAFVLGGLFVSRPWAGIHLHVPLPPESECSQHPKDLERVYHLRSSSV